VPGNAKTFYARSAGGSRQAARPKNPAGYVQNPQNVLTWIPVRNERFDNWPRKEILSMKKTVIAATTMMSVLALCATLMAAAPQKPKPNDKVQKDVLARMTDILNHRFTPLVKNVKVGAAKAGQPISITVDAGFDDNRAVDKISSVKVFYSGNNGQTWARPVALAKSGNSWTGSIPKQAKGTLLYYVWAQDSSGNVSAELPCKVTTWPPSSDKCMVSGAVDPAPVDDPTSSIENNLDVWGFKVGMDDNYIYMQLTVEGSISKGTTNPPHINGYATALFDLTLAKEFDVSTMTSMMGNPDMAKKKFKGKENMMQTILYSPLGRGMAGANKDCFVPKFKVDDKNPPKMDTSLVDCSAKGPDLFLRFSKKSLPASMKNQLASLGGLLITILSTDPKNMSGGFKFGDILRLTRVKWNPRTIKVN
jgi:hypothetical protein